SLERELPGRNADLLKFRGLRSLNCRDLGNPFWLERAFEVERRQLPRKWDLSRVDLEVDRLRADIVVQIGTLDRDRLACEEVVEANVLAARVGIARREANGPVEVAVELLAELQPQPDLHRKRRPRGDLLVEASVEVRLESEAKVAREGELAEA